jgi:hypothetical protein
MATPVLNNGIFLREEKVKLSSKIDEFSLSRMMGEAKPTDLGLLDIWAMARKVESPLYNLATINKSNVIVVDHPEGMYTWKTPIGYELPVVVDDINPANVRKGYGGTKFKVKFNKQEFGHGDIITYDKITGVQCVVTEDDIIPTTDGFVYTLKTLNATSFVDNQYLKPNTRWFKISSFGNEYTKRFSSLYLEAGYREFYNFVGDHQVTKEMRVDEKTAILDKVGIVDGGMSAIVNFVYRFKEGALDPSVRTWNDAVRLYGKDFVKEFYKKGKLAMGFLTKLESQMLSELAREIEQYLMWGEGGLVQLDGPKASRLSVGLWRQLNNAYTRVYTLKNFSLKLLREAIYNFYNGRVDWDDPDPSRQITLMTGMGGAHLLHEAIRREANAAGFVIQAAANNGIGAIQGQGMNLTFGYFYQSIILPFIGRINFVINPAFDNIQTNTIENPLIPETGFNLSSHLFIAFDVVENLKDNLLLLKHRHDVGTRIGYINGTADYLGRNVVQSAGKFSGFEVWMKQYVPSIMVKDPTKVLKISMKNPITGGNL